MRHMTNAPESNPTISQMPVGAMYIRTDLLDPEAKQEAIDASRESLIRAEVPGVQFWMTLKRMVC